MWICGFLMCGHERTLTITTATAAHMAHMFTHESVYRVWKIKTKMCK